MSVVLESEHGLCKARKPCNVSKGCAKHGKNAMCDENHEMITILMMTMMFTITMIMITITLTVLTATGVSIPALGGLSCAATDVCSVGR